MATRLNTESVTLLWCLVAGGTLLQAALTVFALEFFADVQRFWALVLDLLPAQLVLNLAAGYLMWSLGRRRERLLARFAPLLRWRQRRTHAT